MVYIQPFPEIQGWMSEEELQWLFAQAQTHNKIAEVGCWFGRSTHALLSGNRGVVHAIDHFDGSPTEKLKGHAHEFAINGNVYAEFCKNCAHFPNLLVYKASSQEAAPLIPDGSLDMVFIDAEHTYEAVSTDVDTWKPKVRAGGMLCGHDRVLDGVAQLLREHPEWNVKHEPGSIWSVII